MLYPDYPFNNHYVNLRGLKLHYLDEGSKDAEPVVMVHGNPSWSFYYRKLVQTLSPDYRCIVPDHIGMGLSDKPSNNNYEFTLDRRVDDLEELLDQLKVNKNITLVVHDWGGMIGMAFANRYPERIKRLVILNTGAFHLPKDKSVPWQLVLSRIPIFNAILNQGLNLFCLGAVKYCVTRKPMPEDVGQAYVAPYNSWQNRLAVKKFVEAIPLKPGDNGYDTIDKVEQGLEQFSAVPMLICWGLKDFVFDEHFLNEWEKRFPKAETHRFEDAGHYILEDAAEDVIPLINEFIKNHPI
ncbi:MAG: alpha/beta fold hydrolase [Gammaproteobacteria bacterium]|jgi:cis-3-alkyl-4-acyloxetan-2-one decarboxylase|nr:alpha/beta fold hydrolase [Gammaproteobacteria bacterium]